MPVKEDQLDFQLLQKIFTIFNEELSKRDNILALPGTPEDYTQEVKEKINKKYELEQEKQKIKILVNIYLKEKYNNVVFFGIRNNELFDRKGLISEKLINCLKFLHQSFNNIITEKKMLGNSVYTNSDYTNIIFNSSNILDLLITEIYPINLEEIPILDLLSKSIYKIAEVNLRLNYGAKNKIKFIDIKDYIDYVYYLFQALELYSRSSIYKLEFINQEILKLKKMKLTKKEFILEKEKIVAELYQQIK